MRLELTRRGDYAVRAMVDLARLPSEWETGGAIAARTDIPSRFVTQVMGDLVRGGLVEARIGRTGGYRLSHAPAEITVLALVEAVEGDSRRRRCVLRRGACRSESPCQVHDIFADAQEALIGHLAATSLASAAGV